MNRYKRSWLPAIVVVAISFAASYGFTGPLRAAVPTLFGEVHGSQMAINRRLDITAFTLAYFRKPFQLPKLATSLGVGPAWASRAPRKAIRLALERSGLRVSEGSTATFAEIAKRLGSGARPRVAIVFLTKAVGIDQLGYCLALTRYGKKGFFVSDIGSREGWLSLRDAVNWLGPYYTGTCLFVRPGGAAVPSHAYALDRSHEIVLNIGEIAQGPGILQVPFLLRDTLNCEVSIGRARGSCFCFRNARIVGARRSIAPGAIGKVVLSFSRAEIGVGIIAREVLISFKGYPGHFLKVLVKCHITATHPPIQLTWYPQAIDLGVLRSPASPPAAEGFTVLTPKGVLLKAPRASPNLIRVARIGNPSGKAPVDDFGRTAHEFSVSFSRLPIGPIGGRITVRTTDEYLPKIVIPITGQVERAVGNSGGADR